MAIVGKGGMKNNESGSSATRRTAYQSLDGSNNDQGHEKGSPMSKKQKLNVSITAQAEEIGGNKDVNENQPTSSTTTTTSSSVGATSIINEYQGFTFQLYPESHASTTKITTTSTPPTVDVLAATEMTPLRFFHEYIAQRKPCIVDSLPPACLMMGESTKLADFLDVDGSIGGNHEHPSSQQGTVATTTVPPTTTTMGGQNNNNPSSTAIRITKKLLINVAGNETIQVERRHNVSERFGQNRTSQRQVIMTVQDFLQRVTEDDNGTSDSQNDVTKDDDDGALYYWSTQEDGPDDDDDPFHVPCKQLLDHECIPQTLPWAGQLILSSCNLWMGRSDGTSSGLHHDYHDNFYLLLKGRKRIRLFSPDCAPYLATYGTIERIYPNGLISYVGNETRTDGVPRNGPWSPQLEGDDDDGDDDGNDDDDGDYDEDGEEEDEIVIGKGFDYVSDDDDSEGGDGAAIEDGMNQKDDFDEIMGLDDDDEDHNDANVGLGRDANHHHTGDDQNAFSIDDDDVQTRPNSFCRIDPCRDDKDKLHNEFPSLAKCVQVMVELDAGQVLYLPAGWFHEVTSYISSTTTTNNNKVVTNSSGVDESSSNDDDGLGQCHLALNYWYHPPDALQSFDHPYQDDFWKKKEQRRRRGIKK